MLRRFLTQPNKAYRNAHVVLGLLGLHFLVASMVYFWSPLAAMAQFRSAGAMLGQPYPVSEYSHVWRILAAGNVFTLAFLCFAIQVNPKRFEALIPVFLVLKGFSALGFLFAYVVGRAAPWTMLGYPFAPFLAVFLWDSVNAWMVWYFGGRARDAVIAGGESGERTLVPRLLFERVAP